MDRKLLKSILLIITYIVLLVLAVIKFDTIFGLLCRVLSSLKPLFLGFAIAFVLNRPSVFFQKFYRDRLGAKGARFAMPLAVLTAYLLLIAVIVGLFSFILPKVVESIQLFGSGLGGYTENLQEMINRITALLDQSAFDVSKLTEYLKDLINEILNGVKGMAGHVVEVTSGIITMLVTLTLAIVFSIYMLAGRDDLMAQGRKLLRAYVPEKQADWVSYVITLSADTFTNFVSGQLTEACILGGLCAVGMLFIQADYAPLIGIVIGITALVPVAGAYIGGVLSAFLLLMVSPAQVVPFVIFLVVLQQIEGNIIYPRVVGTSIGLPAIWVLAAVTMGGGLFGFLGVLLSVPVASVLYTLLKRDVKWRLEQLDHFEGEP